MNGEKEPVIQTKNHRQLSLGNTLFRQVGKNFTQTAMTSDEKALAPLSRDNITPEQINTQRKIYKTSFRLRLPNKMSSNMGWI